MASPSRIDPPTALLIDRLATAVAKDPRSKEFLPLADEYMKVGMWQEAAGVLEDGLKVYPGFVTAMVALGRAYDLFRGGLQAHPWPRYNPWRRIRRFVRVRPRR